MSRDQKVTIVTNITWKTRQDYLLLDKRFSFRDRDVLVLLVPLEDGLKTQRIETHVWSTY